MSQHLVAGQNCSLPQEILQVVVTTAQPADVSSFRLYAGGKTRQDEDFIFYGQLVNEDQTIRYNPQNNVAAFEIDLPHMRQDAEKIAFTVTSDDSDITTLKHINLEIFQAGSSILACEVNMVDRKEAALILGEMYKRDNAWKFRFVDQGFNGGLKPLAQFYGVNISEDVESQSAPASPPTPPPSPKINLSKVTLTKEAPRFDLRKADMSTGLFKVNLNWCQKPPEKQDSGFISGLLSRSKKSGGIDLDLGAFVRLQDGQRAVVQALGNSFGQLEHEPYVLLLGDDRTGAQADGEWIHINGKKFSEIDTVLIYAFIYEGAPNWAATDGVVTIHIPRQPEIETRLTEGDNRLGMCAIARIFNYNGDLRVERVNRYFSGHRDMDKAFGWGFRWGVGSK